MIAFPLAHIVQVVLRPPMFVPVLTVFGALTVYVPVEPFPLPSAVIVVPKDKPAPDKIWPTAITPTVAAETVSVVPEIVPVNSELAV